MLTPQTQPRDDLGSDTPGSGLSDQGVEGDAATGPAPEVPSLTLQNYDKVSAAQLLAWLVAHGVDPYANTPLIRLRRYVSVLLQAGVPPAAIPPSSA